MKLHPVRSLSQGPLLLSKHFKNSFNISEDGNFYSVSSGSPFSEVAKDVLNAGRLAKEDIIENRLMNRDGFFHPNKHPNLKIKCIRP